MRNIKLTPLVYSIFLVFAAALLFSSESASANQIGTVNGDNLNVRMSPSAQGDIVGQLNTGDQVDILSKSGDWYKIMFQGQQAYAHGHYIDTAIQTPTAKPKASTTNKVKVIVNGQALSLPIEPPIVNGRVFVPFRGISETLGVKVFWLSETKEVRALDHGKAVLLTIGSPQATVDGQASTLSDAPFIKSAHTVIPLRFFAESFGASVSWDGASKTVTINRVISQPEIKEPHAPAPKLDSPKVNVETLNIYQEPFTGGERLGTLQKGDDVKVTGIEGDDWLRIEFEGQTGYVYRQFVTGSVAGGITAKVNATELNVRTAPDASASQIGQFAIGQEVQVYSFVGNWAKVNMNGQTGYVHSYYLNLFKENKPFAALSEPAMTSEQSRSWLTWVKQGRVESSHKLIPGGVEIHTTATEVAEWNGNYPGIAQVTYAKGTNGTTITIKFNPNYHFVVRHSVNDVRITVLTSGLAGKRIAVDAGHGDHDPGAKGVTGLYEKNVNLDVSLRLGNLLENAGAHVIYTRSTDKFIPLSGRVEIAHQQDVDVFMSVHADSFKSSSKGSTTFYHSGNPSWEQSKQLSDITIQKLTSKLGTVNRGSNEKSLHVIRETEIPAILVELAFLSNPSEEALLKQDQFRQKAADALYESLVEFYN